MIEWSGLIRSDPVCAHSSMRYACIQTRTFCLTPPVVVGHAELWLVHFCKGEGLICVSSLLGYDFSSRANHIKGAGLIFTLKRRGLCSAPTKGSLMMSSVLQLCYWLFLITADYEVLDWLIESQWLWLLIIGHFSFNLHMNQRSQCSLLLWLLIIGSVWYWSVLPVAACGFEVFWWCVQGTW